MTIKSATRCRAGLLALCAVFAFVDAAWAIDPIKIGVIAAPRPPGSEWQARQARAGIEIALKMINDAGGALGRPFAAVFVDRQGPPDKAGEAVDKLVTQDKVTAVIGEDQSAAALASVDIAHRHKVPYITTARSHAIGAKLYPEVYNLGMSSTQIAAAIADAMKAMGVKRVVAFTENSDVGIEAANLLAHQLNSSEIGIQYSFETLDPAAADFAPALQRYKSNPPDVVVQFMRPPAAYALLKELHQQGLAPSARTWIYDAANLMEDPAFWQNVGEPARGMLVLGAYHPKTGLSELGRKVAAAYAATTGKEPGSAVFQAADSLLLIAAAIKSGGSSEPEAITQALENLKWTGTRGEITFAAEKKDARYHQWFDVPAMTFQITAAKQPIGDTRLVQEPGKPFDPAQLEKPR